VIDRFRRIGFFLRADCFLRVGVCGGIDCVGRGDVFGGLFGWGEELAVGSADDAGGDGLVAVGGAGVGEGALVDAGDFERVEQELGALEVDLSGGDGLEEHGRSELDGFGVFERRELDFVLFGVDPIHGKDIAFGIAFRLDGVLLPAGVERLDDSGAAVGVLEFGVEEAEGSAAEGGRLALATVGFEVSAERDDGGGGVHWDVLLA